MQQISRRFRSFSRKWGDSFKVFSSAAALAIFAKALILPYLTADDYSGPVANIHNLYVDDGWPGDIVNFHMKVDQHLPCYIVSSSIWLTDYDGVRFFVPTLNGNIQIPLGDNQHINATVQIPVTAKSGASATEFVIQYDCNAIGKGFQQIFLPMDKTTLVKDPIIKFRKY